MYYRYLPGDSTTSWDVSRHDFISKSVIIGLDRRRCNKQIKYKQQQIVVVNNNKLFNAFVINFYYNLNNNLFYFFHFYINVFNKIFT